MQNQLRQLSSMSDVKKTIRAFGKSFTIRLLNTGETRDVFIMSANLDAATRDKIMAIKTLARAIWAIDGEQLVYEHVDENEEVSPSKLFAQNERIIEQWPWAVTSKLYTEYINFEREQFEKFEQLSEDFLGTKITG